jgi:hypothetical protein
VRYDTGDLPLTPLIYTYLSHIEHKKHLSLAISGFLPHNEPMNRKQIISWCLFDFANSSYSAVIAAVVFQVYYINVIVGNTAGRGISGGEGPSP